jgi:hypothetical protein
VETRSGRIAASLQSSRWYIASFLTRSSSWRCKFFLSPVFFVFFDADAAAKVNGIGSVISSDRSGGGRLSDKLHAFFADNSYDRGRRFSTHVTLSGQLCNTETDR